MAGEKIVELMLRAGREAVPSSYKADMVFGTVASTSPLKIQVENEPNLLLTESFLILTRMVKDVTLKVSMSWETTSAEEHTHQITSSNTKQMTLHNALTVGDKVLMLRVQEGQRYIVLDKLT